MKRNIVLGVLLIGLAVAAWLMFNKKPDTKASIDRSESNFKIEEVGNIGRIVLIQSDGKRTDLRRNGDHWLVNDVHRARQTNVDHLLRGIKTQHLDHIPNKAATANIIKSIQENYIQVQIFDLQGNKMLGYFVGGVTNDEKGTYFLKEGSKQPYCLKQPGFDGALRVRYEIPPVNWRDVHFWAEENERMDTLKVHYPMQKQHSFVISKKRNEYEVEPLFSTTPRRKGPNVSQRVKSYFTQLSKLACEDYINDAHERDSVLRMVPFMEMEMIYPDKKTSLKFYTAGEPSNSEFSPVYERYFVEYEGRDFMIGQHNVMKPAFRSYEFFFE